MRIGIAVAVGLVLIGAGIAIGRWAVPSLPTPATTTSSSTAPMIKGRVTGPNGAPVAGAYIIGLRDFQVSRTDEYGKYSIPCNNEAIMASTWIPYLHVPGEPGETNASLGNEPDQSIYNMNEDDGAMGLGYAFSGGASTAAAAAVPRCNGSPTNFQLPIGGNVQMIFPNQGALWRFSDPGLTAFQPPSSFYGTNLGWNLGLLAAGRATITGTFKSCSGLGVTSSSGGTWDVAVQAGRTTNVTCES